MAASAVSKLALLVCEALSTKFSLGSSVSSPRNNFILAGQSNMTGKGGVTRGKWDANVPPECTPNQLVLKLSAQLVWEEAREPLHADIDVGKTCGVGPGMAFANEILQAEGSSIRVLALANGLEVVSCILNWLDESVKVGGTIRTVLRYQGESDTVNRDDAEAYKGNFERLVSDLRSDLKNRNLPMIQVYSTNDS